MRLGIVPETNNYDVQYFVKHFASCRTEVIYIVNNNVQSFTENCSRRFVQYPFVNVKPGNPLQHLDSCRLEFPPFDALFFVVAKTDLAEDGINIFSNYSTYIAVSITECRWYILESRVW